MRRARAAAGDRWTKRWDTWLPGEDRRLAELAPLLELEQVARELASEFGVQRTREAVRHRASRLGIQLQKRYLSLADLEGLFGIDGGTVIGRWVTSGALRALPHHSRGRAARWRFRATDVEAFLRAFPWLYDWRRMQRSHRLRSLAEVIDRADPWLTLPQVAARTGLTLKQVRRLLARDVLPYERRWHGGGPWGTLVVRAADLDTLNVGAERAASAG